MGIGARAEAGESSRGRGASFFLSFFSPLFPFYLERRHSRAERRTRQQDRLRVVPGKTEERAALGSLPGSTRRDFNTVDPAARAHTNKRTRTHAGAHGQDVPSLFLDHEESCSIWKSFVPEAGRAKRSARGPGG